MLSQVTEHPSFLRATIPLYACIYHILFIHLSISGHLGCFHLLAIVSCLFLYRSNQGFKLVRKKEQNKNYAKILKILKIQPYLTKMSQNIHKWREHLGRLFTSLKKLKKNKMLDFLNLTDLPTTKSKCVLKESKIRQLSLYNT